MDQAPVSGTIHEGTRVRRGRMRADARASRRGTQTGTDYFETPAWLERSFVLPVSDSEVTDVPGQSVPHHDDFHQARAQAAAESEAEMSAAGFVRPPSPHIDFARVIRRSDLCRRATRSAMLASGSTGVALTAYLLTAATPLMIIAIVCGFLTMIAIGVRARLNTASIPHL